MLAISTQALGIGAANPETALEIAGDALLEYNGSPKITLYSRGNGTQRYSIRATNDDDDAGGRLLVIRNESTGSDDLVLDNRGDLKLEHGGSPKITLYSRGNGTQRYSIRATNDDDDAGGRLLVIRNESTGSDDLVLDNRGDLKLEHGGSPKITLYSRGNGTQRYSIRATNDDDDAGGRLLVIRNESQNEDVLVVDPSGNVKIPGDILFTGADVAECLEIADDAEPGDVMVIGESGALRRCVEPYDRRVAGVVSGASERSPALILAAEAPGNRAQLALSGTVVCKADASGRQIAIGDLLTTSATPGHAMAASDSSRAFGAVLGKAMAPLSGEVGLLPVLVGLQ